MPSQEKLKPVYYLYGKEDYLVEEALRDIKERALVPGLEALNYHVYDGDSCDPRDVVVACETLPAFSEKRLVLVRRAEALNEEKKDVFYNYIKNPSPSTCLVFLSSKDRVEATPFFKFLEEEGFLRRYRCLYEKETYAWLKNEVLRSGKSITEGAASLLVEIAGGSLRGLKGELEKIMLFAGEKKTIDERDVGAAGIYCKEETVFKLSDAIGRKDVREALRIYGKIASDSPVIGPIARHMRILLKIKALAGKGVETKALPSILGIKGRILDHYIRSSKLFGEEELRGALKRFYLLDRALKSGGSKILLSKLIIDLCSTRRTVP